MEERAEQAKQQKQNNNLLLLACTRGYWADAQHLVQTGADITAKDKRQFTTLHFAAAHGHLDVVTFLWSKGAELDWETPDGRSPLHLAALKGHSTVVHFLLGKQAWADAQDAEDSTALHLAARGSDGQTVTELLKVSASTSITNKLGLTPLAEAIIAGQLANARLLLDKDQNGLKVRPQGWSLLHLVCAVGQTESAAMLLKHGADVQDQETRSGLTPLHAAALSGSVECVRLLLDAKASASATSNDGSLPNDLVSDGSPDRPQLLALLKSSSAASKKSKAASQDSDSSRSKFSNVFGTPPVQAFTALTKEQQLSRVERWAQSGPADPKVVGEIKGFWPEVKKRLDQAHRTMMELALHKVLMVLHNDEDYQKDVGDAKIMDAILMDVKQHPDRLTRYNSDPATRNVFEKMELFTMVLKATNQRGQVPWQATLVPSGSTKWQEQDDRRKKGLEMMLETQKEAIVAAALASSEEEAGQAADAAASQSKDRLIRSNRQHSAAPTTTETSGSHGGATTATSAATAKPHLQPSQATAATARTQAEPAASTATTVKPPLAPGSSTTSSTGRNGNGAAVASGGKGNKPAGSQESSSGHLRLRKGNQHRGPDDVAQEQDIASQDELPAILTWKDLWHQMRFTVIGYAMLLLGLCFWMFYILPKQPQDSNPATGMPQEAPVSTRSSGNIFVSQPQSRMPSS